jgi:hypothetical protein
LQKEEKKKKGQTSLLPPLAEPANNQTLKFTVAPIDCRTLEINLSGLPQQLLHPSFIHQYALKDPSRSSLAPGSIRVTLGWAPHVLHALHYQHR